MKVTPAQARLWTQLACLILDDVDFSASDVTLDGTLTHDSDNVPKGHHNDIARIFAQAGGKQLIFKTGACRRSTSPSRRNSIEQIWHGTEAGQLWARNFLADHQPVKDSSPELVYDNRGIVIGPEPPIDDHDESFDWDAWIDTFEGVE
jgi:hypothetical protein